MDIDNNGIKSKREVYFGSQIIDSQIPFWNEVVLPGIKRLKPPHIAEYMFDSEGLKVDDYFFSELSELDNKLEYRRFWKPDIIQRIVEASNVTQIDCYLLSKVSDKFSKGDMVDSFTRDKLALVKTTIMNYLSSVNDRYYNDVIKDLSIPGFPYNNGNIRDLLHEFEVFPITMEQITMLVYQSANAFHKLEWRVEDAMKFLLSRPTNSDEGETYIDSFFAKIPGFGGIGSLQMYGFVPDILEVETTENDQISVSLKPNLARFMVAVSDYKLKRCPFSGVEIEKPGLINTTLIAELYKEYMRMYLGFGSASKLKKFTTWVRYTIESTLNLES